jgi:hypothetical protein
MFLGNINYIVLSIKNNAIYIKYDQNFIVTLQNKNSTYLFFHIWYSLESSRIYILAYESSIEFSWEIWTFNVHRGY